MNPSGCGGYISLYSKPWAARSLSCTGLIRELIALALARHQKGYPLKPALR